MTQKMRMNRKRLIWAKASVEGGQGWWEIEGRESKVKRASVREVWIFVVVAQLERGYAYLDSSVDGTV
jgi:hypothetical protein